MNGRVYDYNLGRFLSVDPFIQDPGNSQSMNPYSYIMNNPLAGTDPSGYISQGTSCWLNASCYAPGTSHKPMFQGSLGTISSNNGKTKQQSVTQQQSSKSPEDIGKQSEIAKSNNFADNKQDGLSDDEIINIFTGGTELGKSVDIFEGQVHVRRIGKSSRVTAAEAERVNNSIIEIRDKGGADGKKMFNELMTRKGGTTFVLNDKGTNTTLDFNDKIIIDLNSKVRFTNYTVNIKGLA
jgi:hypothetical protein